MKKILVILFIFASSFVYSFEVKPYSFSEFSYYPKKQAIADIAKGESFFSAYTGCGLKLGIFYAENQLNTNMIKINTKEWRFSPYLQDYAVRAGMIVNGFYVEYEHKCTHTVDGSPYFNEEHDKISIGFDSRLMEW